MIYIVLYQSVGRKHGNITLPFDRFRRLWARRRVWSCQPESGRTEHPTTGLKSVVPENNPETPCLLQRQKSGACGAVENSLHTPRLRLKHDLGLCCVFVKPPLWVPRCHGDA
jgi:hypothetical protein